MNIRTSAFRRLAILSLSVLAIGACDDKNTGVLVTPDPIVTITPSSAVLTVGQKTTFAANVANDGTGTSSGVTYSSSNTAVATVAQTGEVTAVAPGTASIIATSKANTAKSAAAQVIVNAVVVQPIVVAVVPGSAPLTAGTTLNLVATIQNSTQGVTYASSDTSVAKVSSTGVVTATQKNGTAVITVSSIQDPTKTASSVITVTGGTTGGAVAIQIANPVVGVDVGGTVTIIATVTGSTNTAKTFTSSDTSVAKVNATTGVVTATNKPGTAVITATASADATKTATAVVTVTRPTVTISATPNPIALAPGQTQTITANIGGSATDQAAGATCTSSDTNVATVTTPGCVVTAVAPGSATITVRSVGDNTKSTTVAVSVTAFTQPSITIQSVTQQVGAVVTDVTPGSTVAGTIVVTMNVTNGNASPIQRVAVRLTPVGGGAAIEGCSQIFTPALAPSGNATISCPLNTAQTNAAGAALIANGTYTLTADAFATATGNPVASANWGQLTLNNTNRVRGIVTYDNTLSDGDNTPAPSAAIDAGGVGWNGGSATVTLTPAIFTGTPIATIDVVMDLNCNGVVDVGEPLKNATITSGTGSVTFLETASMATNGNDNTQQSLCYITSNARAANNTVVNTPAGNGAGNTSTAGTAAGTVAATAQQVDNVEPAFALAPSFSPTFTGASQNSFAGSNTSFTNTSAAFSNATATDGGVGGITYSFYAVPAGTALASPAAFQTAIAGRTAVTNGGQLAGTPNNNAYILIERAMDALGNTAFANVGTFGVDLVGPNLTFTAAGSPANNSTNPTSSTINVAATDSISGVATFNARISGRKVNGTNTTTLTCFDNTGATVAAVGGVCPFVAVAATGGTTNSTGVINVPATDNFYTIDITATDRAGNVSANTISMNILKDATAPTAAITSTTIAGSSVSVTGNVTDNVDLRGYDTRFRFVGTTTIPTDIPFTPQVVVDSYGLPLTGSVTGATGTNAVAVRALTESGAPIAPTAFGFGVVDVAGNYGSQLAAYTAPAGGGAVAGLSAPSFQIAASATTICRTGTVPPCTASSTPTSTTVTATITTPATGSDPLATIYYYYVHPGFDNTIGTGDDYLALFATVAAPVDPTQTGLTQRTFTSTATLAASSLPNTGTYRLVAIGATSAGDAITSNVIPSLIVQ